MRTVGRALWAAIVRLDRARLSSHARVASPCCRTGVSRKPGTSEHDKRVPAVRSRAAYRVTPSAVFGRMNEALHHGTAVAARRTLGCSDDFLIGLSRLGRRIAQRYGALLRG